MKADPEIGTGATNVLDSALDAVMTAFSDTAQDRANVTILLRSAGVEEGKIAELSANPSTVAQIGAHPELAQEFAKRFPGTHIVNYYAVEQALGFDTQILDDSSQASADRYSAMGDFYGATQGPETSDNGGLRFSNGVIVDTVNGQVAFPNDADVAGSSSWLQGAQKWDDKKVDHWRKILAKNGYIEDAKGGKNVEFYDRLRLFHENLYLYGNGEEAVPLTSDTDSITKKDFGGALDPAVLRSEVRTWFQTAYGDDGSDPEVDFFANRVAKVALRVARKQKYSPESAGLVAQARVQEEFNNEPSVEMRYDQQQDDMESTRLRDSIIGVNEVLSGFSSAI